MIAGIETGGTKVVCAVSRTGSPHEVIGMRRIPTGAPGETLRSVDAFFTEMADLEPIEALGVASFGPLNVSRDEDRFGWITGTSKPGWLNTDLLGRIDLASRVPTAVMSDVSGAALGEYRWGAGVGARSLAYATFGTGVGVGIVLRGTTLQGNGFPELGHLLVRRHPWDDFAGSCPFHGDCVEGLAAGPSVLARWGRDTSSMTGAVRERAFEILGWYVAQVVATVAYTTGVDRVVVGGGVLKAPGLLDEARRQLPRVTGGPHAGHAIAADPFDFMVAPALADSGLFGALSAARDLAPAKQTEVA